jgi:hypothetical protein
MANAMPMWFYHAEGFFQFVLTMFSKETKKFTMFFFSGPGRHPL